MSQDTPKLRITRGNTQEVCCAASKFILIGSDPDCDLHLEGVGIPQVALRLTAIPDGYHFNCLEKSFTVLLDGLPILFGALVQGSKLQIGEYELSLEEELSGQSVQSTDPDPRAKQVLEELFGLYQLVGNEGNLQRILKKALEGLQSLIESTEAFIFTLDSAGRPSLYSARTTRKDEQELFSDTLVQEALRTGKAIRTENAMADSRFSSADSVLSLQLKSVLCCPIQVAGKIRGLFYLSSNVPTISYSEDDQRICELYAGLAGTLIHHLAYISQQHEIIRTLSDTTGNGIVAVSPTMVRVLEEAEEFAESKLNILILGESGTGKDLLAHFIHRKSPRRDKPFLVMNCSTLRGEMLASELFGHRRGAFTGAVADSRGLFLSAHQGTLFLDEIGDLELSLQASLLRAIATGKVKPLGQSQEEFADVRIVCATNRNLEEMVKNGQFREDLFYRINQHSFKLPPLRERGEDVVLLAYYFLERAKIEYPEKNVVEFSPDTLVQLQQYAWPGNIRELHNAVTKSVILAKGPLVKINFPEKEGPWVTMADAVRRFQKEYAQKALLASGGDKEKAAKILDVGRSTLFTYLAEERTIPEKF